MHARRKPAGDRRLQPGNEHSPEFGQAPHGAYPPALYEEEISLQEIWQVLRAHWLILVAATLLGGLIAGAAAWWMTPVYRAEVLMAPVSERDDKQQLSAVLGDFGSLAALTGVRLDHKDKRAESIATLRSRQFTEAFVEARQLLPVLFSDRWDESRQTWETDSTDIPTAWEAYALFDKSVRKIREDRTNGLVTLSIEWKDPDVAADWANDLVTRVNARLRTDAADSANRAIGYLREQLAGTSVVELQQVLHRLIEAEMKKIILANITPEYAFKVIDPAVVAQKPIRPKPLVMIVLGLALGLAFGVIVALILNAVRQAPEPGLRPVSPSGVGGSGPPPR